MHNTAPPSPRLDSHHKKRKQRRGDTFTLYDESNNSMQIEVNNIIYLSFMVDSITKNPFLVDLDIFNEIITSTQLNHRKNKQISNTLYHKYTIYTDNGKFTIFKTGLILQDHFYTEEKAESEFNRFIDIIRNTLYFKNMEIQSRYIQNIVSTSIISFKICTLMIAKEFNITSDLLIHNKDDDDNIVSPTVCIGINIDPLNGEITMTTPKKVIHKELEELNIFQDLDTNITVLCFQTGQLLLLGSKTINKTLSIHQALFRMLIRYKRDDLNCNEEEEDELLSIYKLSLNNNNDDIDVEDDKENIVNL